MKPYVVGLGEVLWDVLPEGKKLGGAPANFAYHVSQFGYDAMAISAVGKDALGDETLAALDEKKLNYLMPRVDYPTGTVQVTLDDEGVPTYVIREGVAWDNIPFTAELEDLAQHTSAVCFGSLAQRSAESRATVRSFLSAMPEGALKIFDINLRQNFYTRELLLESMAACNILKINDEELVTLGRLLGLSGLDMQNNCWLLLGRFDLDVLVLTCGVNGSYVFTKGHVSFRETPKVEVADTVGAGDSFTGAFVAGLLSGKPIEEIHRVAVETSAYVCTCQGAMPLLPQEITKQFQIDG